VPLDEPLPDALAPEELPLDEPLSEEPLLEPPVVVATPPKGPPSGASEGELHPSTKPSITRPRRFRRILSSFLRAIARPRFACRVLDHPYDPRKAGTIAEQGRDVELSGVRLNFCSMR
jgi:hypothetical protein